MSTTCSNHLTGMISGVFRLVVSCALLMGVAFAQEGQNLQAGAANAGANDTVAQVMDRWRKGDFSLVDVTRVADAGAVQAIPELRKQFALADEENAKGRIASALVRLGDKDVSCWNYLVSGATAAIESDAPFPADFDSRGKLVPGPSAEFIAWAEAHNRSIDSALEQETFRFPVKVLFLADSRDRRAIPLLRQALLSRNYMIQAYAAEGLAQLQDKDSIALIIGACQKAPADIASGLALNSLLNFTDAQAQSAAEAYVPRELIEAVRKERHLPGSDSSGR